jgi:hypothetical protein
MLNVWFFTDIVTCYTEKVSLFDEGNSGVFLFSVPVGISDLLSLESLAFYIRAVEKLHRSWRLFSLLLASNDTVN